MEHCGAELTPSALGTTWRDSGLWDSHLPQVSTASLHCGSRCFFCEASMLRGAPSVRAGVEAPSDFLLTSLCFGAICQVAMPVQVKAARLPILALPLASCGCGLGHRPPPTSVCSAVACSGWRMAGDATQRALRAAPACRSDRPTERLMIAMCGVRGLTLRSDLFFLSLPSFWGNSSLDQKILSSLFLEVHWSAKAVPAAR